MMWFKEQHYSLSAFIHIRTSLSIDTLCQSEKILEWSDTYQYTLKLCKIQDEEMSLIGAFFYGSLFIYREDLLLNNTKYPIWQTLDATRPKPIIIDLAIKPFRGSNKYISSFMLKGQRRWRLARLYKKCMMIPPRPIPVEIFSYLFQLHQK